MSTDRNVTLAQIEQLLKTPDGVALVEELEEAWDQTTLLGKTPEHTAYNVGMRDAFKFIKMLQTGELKHE